jgi:hypothetical protein
VKPDKKWKVSPALGLWLAFLLLLLPTITQAQFIFSTNDGAITITSYTGTNDDVCIPSTTNGLPVTCISNKYGILSPYATVTNITIPYSATNIGLGALEFVAALGTAPPGALFELDNGGYEQPCL